MKVILFKKTKTKFEAVEGSLIALDEYSAVIGIKNAVYHFKSDFNLAHYVKKNELLTVLLCYIKDQDSKLYPMPPIPNSEIPISAYPVPSADEASVQEKTRELESIIGEIQQAMKENEDEEKLMNKLPRNKEEQKMKKEKNNEKKAKKGQKGRYIEWEEVAE